MYFETMRNQVSSVQYLICILTKAIFNNINKKKFSPSSLTFAISSGVRAPFMSCLFASISRDDPESLCQMNKQVSIFKKFKNNKDKRPEVQENTVFFLQDLSRKGFILQVLISAFQKQQISNSFKHNNSHQVMQ